MGKLWEDMPAWDRVVKVQGIAILEDPQGLPVIAVVTNFGTIYLPRDAAETIGGMAVGAKAVWDLAQRKGVEHLN